MKLCSQCGQTKPFDAFGKNRTAPDKLAYWCKECCRRHGRKHYAIHREQIRVESLFKPGMNWNNYGYGKNKWHVDHIRPISSFNFESTDDPEFKECWSLENLQPLWQEENLRKGAKIMHGSQNS